MKVQQQQWPSVSGKKRVLRIPGGKTKQCMNLGTWNVRSLFQAGKLKNAIVEMNRLKIDVLGTCETWWPDSGEFFSENMKIFFSGNQNRNHRNGVAVILDKKIADNVTAFIPKSDRTMLLKIKAEPLNLNIIQAYAPTADKSMEETESFYDEIHELLQLTKPHDINIVQGDFNAKVGSLHVDGIAGGFGLGERNERGDRLIQFCQEHNMKISNTWFKLPPRRLYTWKSPQDNQQNTVRNQIDYILINKRFGSAMKKVSTYPGADIFSDHNLLLAKMKLKLTTNKRTPRKQKLNTRLLKENESTRNLLTTQLNNEIHKIQNENSDPLTMWNKIKSVLSTNAQKTLVKRAVEPKTKWMTEEILQLIEERRKYKSRDIDRYREINKEIRRKVCIAKTVWIDAQCREIENLQLLHDDFNIHKKLKESCGIYRKRITPVLLNDNNQIVCETSEKKKIWEDYVRNLFYDNRAQSSNEENGTGPPITIEEVKEAIRVMSDNKAAGPDEIPVEIIKLIDDNNLKVFLQIFNYIYDTGQFPQDWLKSTFITLPKKSNAKKCSEYRLISLMNHSLKIFLKIIHKRIYKKCEKVMGDSQFGFKNGMGTREALFCVHVLVQNCKDVQKDVFLCFVDYEKAFDTVQHDKLMEILHSIGIDTKELRCIKNLYWNQTAEIRVNNENTDEIEILKGVRQGCLLSPLLFNIYSEAIFQEALQSSKEGIKVNGVIINNIRYADDTTLFAENINDLQTLVCKLDECSNRYGLRINVNKTKFMVVSRRNTCNNLTLKIRDEAVEMVPKFKYLGSWINRNWDCTEEIRTRIEMARASFCNYKKILCSHNFNIRLKIRFIKCYVWSILLYAMEIWTLKIADLNRLEAFEMWLYRRILKIPWTDHVSNNEVLSRINQNRQLLTTIKRRKTAYLGHILRNPKYQLLQLILEGKVEGRRCVGRKQLSWLRNIRNWTGLSNIRELWNVARDREAFCDIVNNIP